MVSNGIGETTLGRSIRRASRVGTAFGVLAMVGLCLGLTQVGPCPNNRCTTDAGCDDSNGCTTDTCDTATGACTHHADCATDHCVNSACVECLAATECDDSDVCTTDTCTAGVCGNAAVAGCCSNDAGCDDGDACTTDTCGTDNTCTNSPVTGCCNADTDCDDSDPCTTDTCGATAHTCSNDAITCPAGQTCVGGNCVVTCTTDGNCDDGDLCTTDTCVAGVCVNAAKCDDNVACTDDTCDSTTGDCTNADNCTAGQSCDTATGLCTACVTCTTNADCPDDGLFCNGAESCDTTAGCCTSSGSPCTTGQTCNEVLNACETPTGTTVDCTLGTDNLAGTAGNDTFSCLLTFNAPTGTNVPSMQTGDNANGGDGDGDVLNAQFNFNTATTVAPTLSGIETINITDFGTGGGGNATTLVGSGITGAATINFLNGTNTNNAFVVSNLPNLVDVGITNQAVGATLSFASGATSGSTDEATVTFNGMTAGTLTLTTGTTNGLETLNIVSASAANSVADIAMNGTTLTKINVSGDANLTITTTLDANVTTVDASAATGKVNLTQTNAGNFTFTGGSGDDTIALADTYGTSDTLNGGTAGTDTLSLESAQAGVASNQTNVTSFEALTISDSLVNAITASRFGTIGTITLRDGVSVASTLTVTNGTNIKINAGTDSTANLTVDVPGLGTSDAITLTLNDHDTGNAYIFTGVETLNLVSNGNTSGAAADGDVNTIGGALSVTNTSSASGAIVLTGATSLTTTGAVTAASLTGGAFTGSLTMTTASTPASGGISITSGTGNDTLYGSANNDTLNAGDGTNIFFGRAGVDSITCGTGVDTIQVTSAAASGADRKLVTGFTAGTSGDVINLNAALSTLDGTDNFATASTIQTHSTAGNLTVAAATEVVKVTANTVTNFTDANSLDGTNLLVAIGGTITVQANGNQHLFAVSDGTNTGIYYGDAGANSAIVAAELTLVVVLPSTTLGNLVFSNFSNN